MERRERQMTPHRKQVAILKETYRAKQNTTPHRIQTACVTHSVPLPVSIYFTVRVDDNGACRLRHRYRAR